MNRNTEAYFTELPNVNIERSMLDLSQNIKLTGNFSRLIPFYVQEVLPGSTFQVETSIVCRLQTLLSPVFDDAVCDISYFFTPNRLTWDHWQAFCGENITSAWLDQASYTPPLLSYPVGGFNPGTIADYMGVPVGVQSVSDDDKPLALPFRAYALICNEFYRDQNLTDPLNIPTGDAYQTGTNGDSYINDVVNGGMPFKVAKLHDYFTSCLPSPQRSTDPVSLSLTSASVSQLEVYSGNSRSTIASASGNHDLPMSFVKKSDVGASSQTSYFERMPSGGNNVTYSSTANLSDAVVPNNLWADASGMLASVTINELRLAFQLQRFYEKQALYGSRYREQLHAFFGVTSPDARLQVPEYLGGHRFPIVIHQVANTAESSSSNLGDLGAMSNTSDVHGDFVKSFVEHGYIIGVMCLRIGQHSYSQGLEKFWSRRTREEWFWPTFSRLGAQPVAKREIFMSSSPADNAATFGFQEAWADYRHRTNRIAGEMRPGISNSLAHWHFGDYYTQAPSLSDSWIREDLTPIDRALAVTSAVADQFLADIYVKNTATLPMPVYSIPGMIDHF